MRKLCVFLTLFVVFPVFAVQHYELKSIKLPDKKKVQKNIDHYNSKWTNLNKTQQKKRNKAIKLADKGNKLYQKSQYTNAYNIYQEAFQIWPDILESYASYAAILLKIGRYDEAIQYLDKYIAVFALDAKAYKIMGLAYYKKDNFDKALLNYFTSAKLEKKNKEIWTEIANIYYEAKDYPIAIKMYKQAMKNDTKNPQNYLGLGNIYFIKKDYKNAKKIFSLGLKYNHKNQALLDGVNQAEAFLMFQKALILEKKKKYNNAIALLEQVKKNMPDYEPTYLKLGDFYYKIQKNNLARTNLQKAFELNSENPKTLNYLGLVAYRDKHYDQALDYYQKALLLDDKNSDIYVQIGEIYIQKQAYDLALNFFEKALKLNSKSSRIYLDIGICQYELEKYKEALKNFEQASKLNKKEKATKRYIKKTKSMLAVKKGNDYFDSKDFGNAKNQYQLAVSLVPDFIEAKVSLANTYIELDQTTSAIKILESVYTKNTNSGIVIESLANAYEKIGEIDKSKQMYKKLESLKGYDPLVYYNIGLNYELKNQLDKAIVAYKSSLKIKKDFQKSLKRLSFVYYKKGVLSYNDSKFDEAITNLNMALKFTPDNLDIKNKINYIKAFKNISLAIKAYKNQLFDMGIQFYETAKKFDDTIPEIYYGLGQIYFDMAKLDLAEQNLQNAIKLKDDFLEAYKLLSDVKRYKKEYAKASILLNKAITLDPKDASLYNLSGYIFYLNNDFENAKKMYFKAVSLRTNDPDVHVNLGLVYFKEGKYSTAEREFIVADRLRPNMDDVYLDLGLVYYKQNKYLKSQRAFVKSISLRSDVPNKYFYLARTLYYISGFLDQAIFNTKKALSMKDSVIYYYGLGKMYEKKMSVVRLSETEKFRNLAIEAYQIVVKRAPKTQVGKWSEERLAILLQEVRLVALYSAQSKTSDSFSVDGDSVFVGDQLGNFYEFGPSATNDNLMIWNYKSDSTIHPLVVNANSIFFANETTIFSFGKSTKSLQWKLKIPAKITSKIIEVQGTLLFVADDGNLYGVQNGTILFKNNIGMSSFTKPLVVGNQLVVANAVGEVFSYNRNTKELLWKFNASDDIRSDPLLWGNKIIISSKDGHIFALDSNTGKLIWDFQTIGEISTTGLIQNNMLYCASSSVVYEITQDGKENSVFVASGKITSDIGVNSVNRLFVGDDRGTISCYDLNRKKILWTYHTEQSIIGQPVLISDNAGYFNTTDGSIYKLEFLR